MAKRYLAHIRRDSSGTEQTIYAHLHRVADLMSASAAKMGLSSMARLIGMLHDLGKCSEAFADYLSWSHAHPGDYSRRGTVDHSSAGGQLLMQRYGGKSDDKQLVIEIAALAIFSHHTGLLNYIGEHGLMNASGREDAYTFSRRMDKADILTGVNLGYFFENIISEEELDNLFAEAVHELSALEEQIQKQKSDEEYFFYWGMVVKILFSMLVDADRLDSAEFELDDSLTCAWDTESLWEEFSAKLEKKIVGFPIPREEKAKKIATLRQRISDDCLHAAEQTPGIYRLTVPTGGGKTLASMRFALAHAKRRHKKRIIVVIPYTSIIDQNAKEIREIFDRDEAVLEHHSNVVSEEDDGEDTEGMDWRRILTERWDVPVIFTTQVQLLNTLFAGGNSSIRRLHALQDSILIFDEIQTLPVKCTYLFNLAINFLKDFCRTTTVLCTATQPPLEKLDFPIDAGKNAELTTDISEVFEAFRRVRIENFCRNGGSSVEDIAAATCRSAEEEGDVLCIVNLTKQARELYRAVSELVQDSDIEIRVVHLSTKMCPAHRKKVLAEVREELRCRKEHPERRLICISTQLVEAGVDVSFPVVYRALAGFSSIAQAAGRCNRHGELAQGIVRIFAFTDENLSRLEDIQAGQKIARVLLFEKEADVLLSPQVMDEYFRKFYKEQIESRMRYPLHDGNTLLDLLSVNRAGVGVCNQRGDKLNTGFAHAFHDAGRAFEVIDSHAEAVLVPYGAGKELLLAFDAKSEDKRLFYRNMKRAQQYMVNLFSYEIKRFSGMGAVWRTESGVIALREEYYDKALGVQFEEQQNAYCMI
ncbi:CRISPR-associated helicase Cas3' [Selenomonas sp. F0473]|uniref:CRISPR-associated helicase Cas3' n=1 Tax=Selenomonas sp. F0473 TaxID=999423 RepID=UPI0025EE0388|nr:CRISPR-associated helicase Cas3' [Selenomonas sp. F0473]